MDRDGAFYLTFREMLKQSDVEPIVLPPKSPNLNAFLERFFRSLKSESLDRMIFFGERSLRTAVASYVEHYHTERNHQGLGNQIIEPLAAAMRDFVAAKCPARMMLSRRKRDLIPQHSFSG